MPLLLTWLLNAPEWSRVGTGQQTRLTFALLPRAVESPLATDTPAAPRPSGPVSSAAPLRRSGTIARSNAATALLPAAPKRPLDLSLPAAFASDALHPDAFSEPALLEAREKSLRRAERARFVMRDSSVLGRWTTMQHASLCGDLRAALRKRGNDASAEAILASMRHHGCNGP